MEKITFKNVKLGYRNFEGRESEYNAFGKRMVGVILNQKQAKEAEAFGFRVKCFVKGGKNLRLLTVNMKFDDPFEDYNAKVVGNLTGEDFLIAFDEASLGLLDYLDLLRADITVRVVRYQVNGKEYSRAYLSRMTVNISNKTSTMRVLMYTIGGTKLCKKEE